MTAQVRALLFLLHASSFCYTDFVLLLTDKMTRASYT
jgi:hypothetical protein